MAAKSTFEGERRNALAAAERLARRYGMSLDEAALDSPPQRKQESAQTQVHPWTVYTKKSGRFAHLSEQALQAEKRRREEAIEAARERGLDASERRPKRQSARVYSFRPKMRDPESHARALLSETSIPFAEIAAITGLDIYQIVGMKLKMRGKRNRI